MRILSSLNTYYRLVVLIIGTSSLFFILYASLYFYTLKQEKAVYKSATMEYTHEISSLFQLNSRAHNSSNYYISFWDELVTFIQTKDQNWYKEFIESEFEAYEVDFIGVFDLNHQLISKTATEKVQTANFIPTAAFKSIYQKKVSRFYLQLPEGMAEVFGSTVHPTDDPKRNKHAPAGYFIMIRLLDKEFIEDLEQISSSTIRIVPKNSSQPTDPNSIAVNLALNNWKNENIADLSFVRSFNLNFSTTKNILSILILATVLNLIIFLYYYSKWVYRPVKLITTILEKKDEQSILRLKKSRDEFGYIGNLFEENNNQRKQLVIAKEKAEESDKLKSSFLANLSHEIRTPMNAIMGFSDLLRDENLNETEKSDYIKIIRKNGKNLIGIIEDLIEMSKIDSKQIIPNFRSINLDKCIADLYHSIKITIPEEKEIDFSISNGDPLQKNVLTDEIKLKQVLTNLVTNAVKFTKKGHVTIGYKVEEATKQILIWVDDSGVGIDENNQKVIFDRFRRIEDDFTIELSGLGLGLSITKAYVELLGGTIHVESTPGKGSRFSFAIPLQYADRIEEITAKKSVPKTAPKANETILVAEDDDINFLLLDRILRLKNYTVVRAINGKEAVEIALNNQEEIGLIFMDIKMPIMNGFEAFKLIRKANLTVPVVANTAYSSPEDKEEIIKAGFSSYISKPLNKTEVHDLVDQIFGTN